ncbi:MAG: glycerol-3-phosphate 1-O-acyltransferase PlsY [Pseudomonadota bacterium]
MLDAILIIVAYLFGSFSTAIIACKLLRLPDPRSQGSGNPGATNVLRFGGKKAAIIVLIGDILKGVIPVLLAKLIGVTDLTLALVALAAFLGHLYPVFFGFQGGKGVATAFGVLLGLHWILALCTLGTWLAVAAISRLSSLAALTAAVLTPLYTWWLTGNRYFTVMALLLSILLLWRHRSNIRNLLAGTEPRIGQKKNAT